MSVLLCQIWVDTRSVRFPGLISHVKEPGGGITDYAVDMYFKAVKKDIIQVILIVTLIWI